MLILVMGSTGAGKTTYSKGLQSNLGGLVFSIDEWMTALYWQDMPKTPDINWFKENHLWYTERIERCEDFIIKQLEVLSKIKVIAILDLGFTTFEHRNKYIKVASNLSVDVSLHYLDVSADLRWQRVLNRNQEMASTYTMHVDKGMFDYMEEIFEPPQQSELSILKRVTT